MHSMTPEQAEQAAQQNGAQDSDAALEGEEGFTLASEGVYPDAVVKVSRDQYSAFELKRMVEETKELQLAPAFQRHRVWKIAQQRELIESVLMGIPIPVVYVFENENGLKQMVDGRQRVTTLIDYMNDRFTLNKLKMLPDFDGKKFSQLPPIYRSKLERYQVLVYVIEPPTPERVKYDIFDRVNRGGTQLNNQEMRNALYSGPATELLQSLSESQAFQQATGGGIDRARMRDQYIILRFLAFHALREKRIAFDYKSNLDELLAHFMRDLNAQPPEVLNAIKKTFILAMERCHAVLGKDAFRFDMTNVNKRPINMALFETLTYLFVILDPSRCDHKQLKKGVTELKQTFDRDGYFKSNVDSSTRVDYRFGAIEELATEFSC